VAVDARAAAPLIASGPGKSAYLYTLRIMGGMGYSEKEKAHGAGGVDAGRGYTVRSDAAPKEVE